jgi:hypothetical protein
VKKLVPKLPVQLVEYLGGQKYVTVFEPEMAIPSMKVRGFRLVGYEDSENGPVPVFERAGKQIVGKAVEAIAYEYDYDAEPDFAAA